MVTINSVAITPLYSSALNNCEHPQKLVTSVPFSRNNVNWSLASVACSMSSVLFPLL